MIAALEEAMAAAEVTNVAREAPASCVAMGFGPGSVHYALRYWLIDPAIDDPTDSAVREHVLATLQRHGWRLAVPDRTVHLVQEDQAWREAAWQRELARRLAAPAVGRRRSLPASTTTSGTASPGAWCRHLSHAAT
ncbi:MAG: hypothetical protein U1F49_04050 [Rubrivivax sp.]